MGGSARGFDRTVRVARTLADLAGSEAVEEDHVAEALGWRMAVLPAAEDSGRVRSAALA
jgi:magnesium chelatase family protein